MRLIIIGRTTYYIIEEFNSAFRRNVMDGSGRSDYTKEYLILKNGTLFYASELVEKPWSKHLDINDLREVISNTDSKTWRSEDRKKTQIEHLRSVLSIMISHSRNMRIDELLTKESHYDTICYAC